MIVALAVVAGALGALVRGEVTARLGVRRGTAIVNLAGAFLLGLVVGLAGGVGSEDAGPVVVIGVGALGAMTTFSTWMLEVTERPEPTQAPAVIVTLFVGMVLAGVGWLLGALLT